jgi:hypothetical protein
VKETLGDAYPKEQARLRKLLEVYKEIGQPGAFAHAVISDVARRADKAAIEGDLAEMIRMFKEMQGCE